MDKNLKRYFIADAISHFGSGMSLIGLNWFLLMKTGMNEKVGILMTIGIFSGLIALPVAGPIADRFNRKSVLMYSNYARACCILMVVIALWSRPFHIISIYFLAAVNGLGWSIYTTSSKSFLQEIVSEENLLKGNAAVEIGFQAGLFSAAAMAGVLYRTFGIQTILLIDAATFFISNVVLARITSVSALRTAVSESLLRKWAKGYEYLIAHPTYFIFGIVLFLPFVATMTLNVVLPGYVSGHLGAGSVTFGMMDMSYGIGACLSGFVVLSFSKRCSQRRMLTFLYLVSIGSLLFMIFNKVIWLALFATIWFGLPNSALRIIWNSIAMKVIDKHYMGRVMAVWSFFSTLLQLFFASFVGVQMDRSGPVVGYLYMAAIMAMAFAGYLWFWPLLRSSLDDITGKLFEAPEGRGC